MQVLELTPRSLGAEDALLQQDQGMVQEAKEVFDLFDKVTSCSLYWCLRIDEERTYAWNVMEHGIFVENGRFIFEVNFPPGR